MSKTILDIYGQIADSIGWYVDEKGFISEILPGADKGNPVLSGQHRLVMPFPEQLKVHDWTNRYAFHPFLQSVVGGDSPVLEKTRNRATTYMNFIVGFVFMSLAKLANNKKEHAALSPEQAAYLKPFSEADQTLIDHLHSIMKLDTTHKNHREYVRFTVVKGRTWKGSKRARVASAQFPVYEALSADDFDRNFCGIKLRVKDVRMIRQMYEHIFPDVHEKEEWERGSDTQSVAPSIETLLQVYARVAICINKVIDDFGDALPGTEYVRVPLEWIDDISNMSALLPEIRKIPQLNGNAARSRVDGDEEPAKIVLDASGIATSVEAAQAEEAPAHVSAPAKTGIVRFGAPLGTKATPAAAEAKSEAAPAIDGSKFKPYTPSKVEQPAEILQAQRQKAVEAQAALRQAGQTNAAAGVELPKGSRMIGNVLYVPLPPNASGGMPAGSVVQDGTVYIPYNQPAQPVGFGASTLGGTNTGMGFNMNQQQQIINGLINGTIDPAQVPGIDAETANMLRGNPILIQNYVQTVMGTQAAAQATRFTQQQQQVPRYLQEATAQGQANLLAQQSGLLGQPGGGIVRFGSTGNQGFGIGGGFGRGFN